MTGLPKERLTATERTGFNLAGGLLCIAGILGAIASGAVGWLLLLLVGPSWVARVKWFTTEKAA